MTRTAASAFFFSRSGSAPTRGSHSIMWPPPAPAAVVGRSCQLLAKSCSTTTAAHVTPTPIIPLTPGHSDMNWPNSASSSVSTDQPPNCRIIEFLAEGFLGPDKTSTRGCFLVVTRQFRLDFRSAREPTSGPCELAHLDNSAVPGISWGRSHGTAGFPVFLVLGVPNRRYGQNHQNVPVQ
jgi:hypothetical protein